MNTSSPQEISMTKGYAVRGMLSLITAQIMVGINIVILKQLLPIISPLMLLEMRFLIATLILLPLHWCTAARNISLGDHFSTLTRKDWSFILIQALCAGSIFNYLILLGLHYTDANVAGIITSALPAIVAIVSCILLREKITSKKILCILLATIGLVIIASEKFHKIGISHSCFGDVIILIGLLPEATYYVLSKIHPNRLPLFLVSSLLNGINAILLLVILFFVRSSFPIISLHNWVVLFILGLSSALFYVFWFMGCQRLDTMLTSLSTAAMPIATVIIAWMVLGERLSMVQATGMGFVIFSVLVYAKKTKTS